jgi:hypothetical protein
VIERAPAGTELPGAVAFRFVGSQKYLTTNIYGDQHRQNAAEEGLASIPSLPADLIANTVEYAVGCPADTTNFEGAGYHYSPMTVQQGPPTKLQLFELKVGQGHGGSGFGVKSLFGAYWRSQHWRNTISQSPHLDRDETCFFLFGKVVTDLMGTGRIRIKLRFKLVKCNIAELCTYFHSQTQPLAPIQASKIPA